MNQTKHTYQFACKYCGATGSAHSRHKPGDYAGGGWRREVPELQDAEWRKWEKEIATRRTAESTRWFGENPTSHD